ncbi:type II toxin-antitoxin system VapC family toxin [Arachnia propionica]|uniref:Ribonuclease VapC n=1 Tax=Arachnia propionica TaxID=1750 RepID=A0A3P1WS02_9ACTN|nr:type II toxin-antitoxin system VapC family toxin [Arachnia propionica]RRD49412.1 PIN domain-containing protein [Arachnia propionica]
MQGALVYLDSSVALRAILNVPQRPRLLRWLESPDRFLVSSRLLRTEIIRTLRRDGRPLVEAQPLLARVGLWDISRETHVLAEAIGRHVKTLDALHLATAVLVGQPITIATHDARMAAAAEYLGLPTIDPVLG